ncbi:hypothetical protein DLAC_01745 [Tieghemostelium lacteum]|uniref:ribonuclease Z n=1 Tax=Tieghemostelium lacteum TaxID=361077 RepID=A0A152A675_TIELA|nr:hypothetical protein DLAC_01745 [Tieghemostelium lacteum]|eukprot:KYR01734.1 hypothetical protein DLAC_01745 [Tieghemostelium lacteum]
MKAGIKIYSNGSGYTDPSFVFWTPDKRYIFNLGNGVHRQNLTSQTRIKDANILFLTHLDPSTMSDVPNFILRNKNDIAMVGPIGTTHSILAHRYYLARRMKSIHVTECTEDEDFCLTDGYLKVLPVVLKSMKSNNTNENNNNNSQKLVDIDKRKVVTIFHNFKIPMTSNQTYKFFDNIGAKPFFDWTVLRGGILHSSTGCQFAMEEIEHYMIYYLLKQEPGVAEKDVKAFKPMRSKEIKAFLTQSSSNEEDDYEIENEDVNENQQEQEEFWAMESRHYRLITRLTKSLRSSNQQKRKLGIERAKIYMSDRIYGPVKSQTNTFPAPENFRSKESGQMDICCYICHLPDIIGKFSNEKADEFGIPKGPLRQQLCKGNSVVSPKTGNTVSPSDVLSPTIVGPVFMVLVCPSVEYLDQLVSNPLVNSYKTSERSGCIVHMIPEDILSTDKYMQFVNEFPDSKWQHIVLNQGSTYHEFTLKSGQLMNGLSEVSPMFFPPLYSSVTSKPIPQGINIKNIQRGRYQQTITLNPLSSEKLPTISDALCTESTDLSYHFERNPDTTNNISNISSHSEYEKSQLEMLSKLSDRELEIVFFGTVCSQSSETRNESCIFLDLFDKGGILLDCGGGSYSQFYRKYGPELTAIKLSKIKLIYLSHMHTDHHQGLFKILEMRHRALVDLNVPENERSLAILSPPPGHYYIREIERSLSLYKDPWSYIKFYTSNEYPCNSTLSQFVQKELGLQSYQTVPVIHAFASTGIVIKSQSGWSLAYSGDTSFCEEFNKAARDCTIMIHEATFQDSQCEKAHHKKHSTFSEAVKSGKEANAFISIFTHFSQRYPSIEALYAELSPSDLGHVSFAFDFMTVNIKNLSLIPKALLSIKMNSKDQNDSDDMDDEDDE